MRVGGENVQIDLTDEFYSNKEVIQWVDDYFRDNPDDWITLPQIASKTEVTMIRKKEVKILTIKYW